MLELKSLSLSHSRTRMLNGPCEVVCKIAGFFISLNWIIKICVFRSLSSVCTADKRWEKISLWEWNAITMKFNFFTYEESARVCECNTSCMLQRKKNNNNEGSVKNNHKLYIFWVLYFASHRLMRRAANPKPLRRQKVVFYLIAVQSESYALHTSILIHITQVHIAIFIDAHMILSHHTIMCKYECARAASEWESILLGSPSSSFPSVECRMVFNALNVAIIIM